MQQAAAKNALKCVLELGGKSPQIVFEDADVARAVPIIVRAIVQGRALQPSGCESGALE